MQLDISKDEVYQVIKNAASEELRKKSSVKHVSNASSLDMFYLDAGINADLAIKHAQHSMWMALQGAVPEFNTPMEETQNILEGYAKSKVMLVFYILILQTLPVDRLATIIQTFTQEMSLIVAAYGGWKPGVYTNMETGAKEFIFQSRKRLQL